MPIYNDSVSNNIISALPDYLFDRYEVEQIKHEIDNVITEVENKNIHIDFPHYCASIVEENLLEINHRPGKYRTDICTDHSASRPAAQHKLLRAFGKIPKKYIGHLTSFLSGEISREDLIKKSSLSNDKLDLFLDYIDKSCHTYADS